MLNVSKGLSGRRLLVYIAAFYFFYETVLFIKNILLFKFGYDIGSKLSPLQTWPLYLVDWFVVTLYMYIISFLFKRRIIRLFKIHYLVIHFLFSLLMGLLIFAVIYLVLIVSGQIPIENFSLKEALLRALSFVDANFLVYFSLLGLIYSFYYFKSLKDIQTKQSNLNNSFLVTKMALLKAQINPHFLFNALNNVSALIYVDREKAQKVVASLSDILRASIYTENKKIVVFKEELELFEKYLHIITTRFQEDLTIDLRVSKEALKAKVPNFLIQPIIENAIKHGYSFQVKKLHINIDVNKSDNYLTLEVDNNGEPLKESQNKQIKKGKGLKNLIERLSLIYNNDYTFLIKNIEQKKGVSIQLKIPFTI